MHDYHALLDKPEFPRSRHYDHGWMMENQMGPNALWLLEWLCQGLTLSPGLRVLDLGCGRAISSIFLAKEFGLRIYAVDLWTDPDENWQRITAAGVGDLVTPLRCEAHALPFARDFFDLVVSVDAYQYFGTDVLYLAYLSNFLRPGGTVGVVVPGLMQPLSSGVPEHLLQPQSNGAKFWEDDCSSFMTPAFWRELWESTSRYTAVRVDTLAEGWRHWRDFEEAVEAAGKNYFPSCAEALDWDQGRYIGFIRAIARRTTAGSMNLYDPSLSLRIRGSSGQE